MSQVITGNFSACLKIMDMGSCPRPRRERPASEPWKYNAVLDRVSGITTFGHVRTLDVGAKPHMCVWLMGTKPSCDGPHLRFPPDARPWSSVDGQFAARHLLDPPCGEGGRRCAYVPL